ncbi:NLRC3 [Symbiodinium sp. CCMP2592]|nr:NLRC3 [Symbiodinium sp. CCMP2592]
MQPATRLAALLSWAPILRLCWVGPSPRSHPRSRSLRRGMGFGLEDGGDPENVAGQPDADDMKEEMNKVEDLLYQTAFAVDLLEMDCLRTLTIANGTKVTLVGTNHASKASAQYAAKVVRDVQPSALILELCSERLRVLIRGNGHRDARAKDWMNPDEPEVNRRQFKHYADETRKAFRAFMSSSEPGGVQKLLVLADIKASIVDGADIDSTLRRRDANLASNIRNTALLGHTNIVAVLGANHLDGVEEELERLEREQEEEVAAEHGLYISHSGCRKLQERQKKLRRKVPPKKWRKREQLSDSSRDKLIFQLRSLLNPAKILNSLETQALELRSWQELRAWYQKL